MFKFINPGQVYENIAASDINTPLSTSSKLTRMRMEIE